MGSSSQDAKICSPKREAAGVLERPPQRPHLVKSSHGVVALGHGALASAVHSLIGVVEAAAPHHLVVTKCTSGGRDSIFCHTWDHTPVPSLCPVPPPWSSVSCINGEMGHDRGLPEHSLA